jgi:YVTN family beta-propeller protein
MDKADRKRSYLFTIVTIITAAYLLTLEGIINEQKVFAQNEGEILTKRAAAPANTIMPATANWHSYKNSTYGIAILYPPDWVYAELPTSNLPYQPQNIITLEPLNIIQNQIQSNSNKLPPVLTIADQNLPFNLPLDKYIKLSLEYIRSQPGIQAIESTDNTTTLGGNPAFKVVYTSSLGNYNNLKTMSVYTIKYNKVYSINFLADASVYSNLLSSVQKIIDSFTFTASSTGSIALFPCCDIKNIGQHMQFSYGIAVNPTTNMIYTTLTGSGGSSNSTIVIDGNTNNIMKNITVGKFPNSIAINPNINRIYVTNYDSDTVSVIDGNTNNIMKNISVGSGPSDVAINPNSNRIYVVNQHSNTISIVNGNTNRVIQTILTGKKPTTLQVNPSTNRIHVTNQDSNTVSVIDGYTNNIIKNVSLHESPTGLAINPNTNKIYVLNESLLLPVNGKLSLGKKTISVIDGYTNNIVGAIRADDASDVVMNPTTNKIYLSKDYLDTISVIDGYTNNIIKNVKVGFKSYPSYMAINPNTNMVYVITLNGVSFFKDIQ